MKLYQILLFVHVSAAAVWFGGGVMFHVIAERATRSNDTRRISSLLGDADFLGKRYFGPASVVTLIAGVWLVFEGGWGFDHIFILGGLTGVALSTILGFGFIEPASRRVTESLAGNATITNEVKSGLDRIRNISRIDLVVLVAVLFLMTAKPGS